MHNPRRPLPSFAAQLRAYKQELGIYNFEMATLLEITPHILNDWLTGRREPLAITQEGAIARLQAVLDRKEPVEAFLVKTNWAKPKET